MGEAWEEGLSETSVALRGVFAGQGLRAPPRMLAFLALCHFSSCPAKSSYVFHAWPRALRDPVLICEGGMGTVPI